jgi:hypothetical protein
MAADRDASAGGWFDAVEAGAEPEPALVSVLRSVTERVDRMALDRAGVRRTWSTPLGRPDEAALWHEWLGGWAEVAAGRPHSGMEAVLRATATRRIPPRSDRLVDAELWYLSARLAQMEHRAPPAVGALDSSRTACLAFVRSAVEGRADEAGDQVLGMVAALAGERFTAQWRESAFPRASWVRAWVVPRGVDLLCDIALARVAAGVDSRAVWPGLQRDVALAARYTGTRLGEEAVAKVVLTVGECCLRDDPDLARAACQSVLDAVGPEHPLGFESAVHLAHLADDDSAATRLTELGDRAHQHGDAGTAARLWIAACAARYSADGRVTQSLHDDLVRAIDLYERQIPQRAAARTKFAFKEPLSLAYRLLVTLNAQGADRSEARLDEALSAVRALISAEGLADLGGKRGGTAPQQAAVAYERWWDESLDEQSRPLTALRAGLAPLRGTGVLHLVLGLNRLVWILYGTDRQGQFHAEWDDAGDGCLDVLRELQACLYEQLDAELRSDDLALARLDTRIEQLGDTLGSHVPAAVRGALDEVDHLLYLPHPEGNLDDFPLTALRLDGRWLTEQLTVTRLTTFTMLRLLISPNLPSLRPNRRAVVVLGDPRQKSGKPADFGDHTRVVRQRLSALGGDAAVLEGAGLDELTALLDGGCGILHYAGHGLADEVYEELPLADGSRFDPMYAENFRGYRLPFVFLCACVGSRIRYGQGGHLNGLLTGLIDRGAPAGLAFATPVSQQHAYLIADQFYRQARRAPFGKAVALTLDAVRDQVPHYAWLSLAAFGDPHVVLAELVGAVPADGPQHAPAALRELTSTWDSAVRGHCALRTPASAEAVRDRLAEAPTRLRPHLARWLDAAFCGRPDPQGVHALEEVAADPDHHLDGLSRLTAQAAACAARLDAFGAGRALALRTPHGFGPVTLLPEDAFFLLRLGGVLIDDQLNGVGLALAGTIRASCGLLDEARPLLRQAEAQLWVYEEESPFVATLLRSCREAQEPPG